MCYLTQLNSCLFLGLTYLVDDIVGFKHIGGRIECLDEKEAKIDHSKL